MGLLLVEMEHYDIGSRKSMGDTPLAWASGNVHDGMVEILLRWVNIDPDRPGEDGQMPLCLAPCNMHAGVVKMLLDRKSVV